ncbi:MAG: PEGA domain-containing protein [Candidatus Curtissbacteria bacterium]|nr:PEGA domain-containing protein [Candidatus Curtissbacteria bacterium]
MFEFQQGGTLEAMPSFLKKLFLASSFLFLASSLTGCTLLGTNSLAALQITSTPEAAVFLDGKHIGKTPFRSDQLKEKEYLVKITAGEASFTSKVSLKSGTLTVINRELNNNFMAQSGETLYLESGTKGLFVSSTPQEADLVLDGKYIAKTPYLLQNIENGDHTVNLSKTGFIKREFAIQTSGEYRLVADVALASEAAKGLGPSPLPAPKAQKLEISKTPQGFLRVRKEPSTTSLEVGRVKTGDQLEIVQETEDWVEIKFVGKQGWISTQYTNKLP